ncbi:hypothetical protein O3M35_002308 [Rhynocoris fuscipes]|uniref:Chloride channel protein n=1 Tax=Rhynocoris fuscipes TaxID=488301 RepID=A0AAW1CL22_9HEMI
MSMFGVFLTKFRIPFTSIRPFLNEIHQRDLAAIGCGAGISAIFGTPIGGTLFALELLSYWSITVTFFIFISSLWAAATSKIIRVIYTWLSTSSSYVHVTYFDVKVDEDIHYSVAEFPIYILMGIIIGFAGAAMNYAHIYTHALRKFYRKNVRWKKLLRIGECIIFAIIIATGSYYLILTRLSARIPLSVHHDDKKEAILSNPENNIAAFLSQSKREVINSILTVEKDYMDTNLFLLLILLYNAALLQLGLYIPTGIIVPTLISGAIMGLLFASVVRYLYPNSDSWARLNKMAHIGAVAHCSGLTHLKFSIGVIMMESLGNPMFGIPIMFTAFITNWVVSFFSYPIYHLLMNFKGYPTLDPELIPLVIEMTARDVMTTPVTCLPLWIGANDLINFLNTDKHLGYPVINKDNITKVEAKDQIKIIGFIYRKQIQKLLESEEDMITQLTSVSAPDPDKRQVSFIRLMDPYPITVKTRTSLVRTYQLFYSLGLLHLPVVDERNYLVGVITRYDLTTIRCDMTFCASRINRGLVVHD